MGPYKKNEAYESSISNWFDIKLKVPFCFYFSKKQIKTKVKVKNLFW